MSLRSLTAVAFLTAMSVSACRRAPDLPPAAAVSAVTPVASVQLIPDQLGALSIAPVGTYRFAVEKEAVGSISFTEDPTLVQAESTLIDAAATFDQARKESARIGSLGTANGISQKELEQATVDRRSAAVALHGARAALRAQGMTDMQMDRMITTGRIAPAGKVGRWVVADVDESDASFVRPGQPVSVQVPAFPNQTFDGKVGETYAVVNPNTHRMTVRCEIADPGRLLRPGMLAEVTIQIHQPVESVAVPYDGVVREGDGTMTAWVTTDRHHFTQTVVKTGLRQDGEVQILDGLQRGELVVTKGAIFLDNMLHAPQGDD